MIVPFVDLRAQQQEVRPEIEVAIGQALDECAFIGGPRVASFEAAFAKFAGARHAVSCASGTDAIEFALRACGVGHGDAVVTVPLTFIATVEGFWQLGATPRFVDVDPRSYNMAPPRLREYLTERCAPDREGTLRERGTGARIAAILPVHLYGLPAPMVEISAIGREFGVQVVEDAAQAHGATIRLPDGREVGPGTLGVAGTFSFYPGKNLGAIGEAGALVTNDEALAKKVQILRDHGQSERYVHVSPDGVNGRMDAIQAAVLEIKLGRLAAWNEARQRAAGWYATDLARSGLQLPVEPEGLRHVYHLYVVRVPDRERVRARLEQDGIGTGLHYPIPLHLQDALASLDLPRGAYPEAERAADEVLSLPMFPHITREQVAYVSERLMAAVA